MLAQLTTAELQELKRDIEHIYSDPMLKIRAKIEDILAERLPGRVNMVVVEMPTREDCIEAMCSISSLAINAAIGFSLPNDCFCRAGRFRGSDFRHMGEGIAFVRAAVVEKINREGFKMPDGWTADGFEITTKETANDTPQ